MTVGGFQAWVLQPQPLCIGHLDLLPAEDKARASRFARRRHSDAFLATRLALRCLLASAIDIDPQEVELTHTRWGKPVLTGEHRFKLADFSVAHTEGLAVIALSRCGRIGADVELQRPVTDLQAIAAEVFGQEIAYKLTSLPTAEQDLAFFRLWTAAEALVKATGTGFASLSGPLPLSLSLGGMAGLRAEPGLPDAGTWTLMQLTLPDRFVGSLVIEGFASGRVRDHTPVAVQLDDLVAAYLQ